MVYKTIRCEKPEVSENGRQPIWCLFSVENNYDQPDHNLVHTWDHRPTLEELAESLQVKISGELGENLVELVRIWEGGPCKFMSETVFRVRKIYLGEPIRSAYDESKELD